MLALLLLACSTGQVAPTSGPPEAFVSDDHGDGAAVFLRGRADGDRLLVDVIARGASDVHGAAIRLKFDPAVLGFSSTEPGGVWSNRALNVSKEGTPGQLAIAWTEKGEVGIDATSESILGTVAFDVKSTTSTVVSFKTERCGLIDRHGTPATVAWRGGTVPAH
jgi:hypothetical protein